MRVLFLGYEAVRLLVLAVIHCGGIVTRPVVFRTLLGLPSKAYKKNIRQEIITRILEDIEDESLLHVFEPVQGHQRSFGLNDAGRSELASELHERHAISEALQSIKEMVGTQTPA